MDATPPCGSGMRDTHCKPAAFRPADNSPSRRHFHTRVPTLPMDTVYPSFPEIATVYFSKSAGQPRRQTAPGCYFFSGEKVTKKSPSFSQEKKKQKEQFADGNR